MSNRRAPPPSGSAPQESLQALNVVKRRVAAPAGPPPAGMTVNFRGPRQVEREPSIRSASQAKSQLYDEDDDDDYDRGHYRRSSRDDPRRNDVDDSYYQDDDIDDRNYDYDEETREHGQGRDDDDREYARKPRAEAYYDREEREERDYRDRDYDDEDHQPPHRDAQPPLQERNLYYPDGKDQQFSTTRERAGDKSSTSSQSTVQTSYSMSTSEVLETGPGKGLPRVYGPAISASAKPGDGDKSTADRPTRPLKPNFKLPSFNFQPIMKSTYRELRHFVLHPCPSPDVIVRCYIERQRSGTNMLAPVYSLCADLEDGTGRELVICRKVWQSRTAHYVFSLKAEDLWRRREQRSRLFLGKLRQSGPHEYTLYDNGICAAPEEDETVLSNAEDDREVGDAIREEREVANTSVARKMERDRKAAQEKGVGSLSEDVSLYRRELCVIVFNHPSRPSPPGLRGLEVAIPNVMNSRAGYAASDGTARSTATAISSGIVSSATVSPQAVLQSIQVSNSNPNSGQSASTTAASTTAGGPPLGPAVSIFNLAKPFHTIRDYGRQNDLYSKSILCLHEKASKYDPLSACLVEFHKRAHIASVKNFQLVLSTPRQSFPPAGSASAHEQMMQSDNERDIIFQLGKTTEDCFNMDFRYPLSLFQAFAIAIARFDAKLS